MCFDGIISLMNEITFERLKIRLDDNDNCTYT